MSKQTAEGQHDTKKQQKNKPDVLTEQTEERVNVAGLPGGLIGLADDTSIQAQAARLGDIRFQTAQRQALAAQIGRVQGNQHLQRVMTQIKQEERTVEKLLPSHGLRDPLASSGSSDPLSGHELRDPLTMPASSPIQRCDACGDPSHEPGEEGPNTYSPLPDEFYDEMIEASAEAQEVRTTAGDLMNWVQGSVRMSLEEAMQSIDQADRALAAAVNATEVAAEQADDQRAPPALEDAANAALEDLLATSAMAQDVIEPIQDLCRAGLYRVFAEINRGLGLRTQQLLAGIRVAQSRVEALRLEAEAAGRELGESFAQLSLNVALGGVGLALTALCPPAGIIFSLAAAGGSMVWDRMLGPSGDHTPSDTIAGTSMSATGLGAFASEGTRFARAATHLGNLTIVAGAIIDSMEVNEAVLRYQTLPADLRQMQVVLNDLLRRYRSLGPFVEGYRSAEARAQALESAASRLERSARSRIQ